MIRVNTRLGTILCGAAALLTASLYAAEKRPAAQTQPSLGSNDSAATQPAGPLGGPRNRAAGMRAKMNRFPRGPMMDRGLPDSIAEAGDASLTDEQIDRLMKFMERNFPNMYVRLARVRDRDPAQFRKMIHRVARPMLPMLKAAAENPELAERMIAEHQSQLRIQELKETFTKTQDPAEKARIREQMRQQMVAAFDLRIDRLRMEVRQLQKRLDDAKGHLGDQERNKQRLIDQRLTDMLSRGGQTP